MAQQPCAGLGFLIVEPSRSHSERHITLRRTPLDELSAPLPIPLPDNTHHAQETDIHVPGRIRTRNPNKRAAVDPLLKPRGHQEQLEILKLSQNTFD